MFVHYFNVFALARTVYTSGAKRAIGNGLARVRLKLFEDKSERTLREPRPRAIISTAKKTTEGARVFSSLRTYLLCSICMYDR